MVATGAAQFVDGVNGVELHDLDRDGDLDVLTAAAIGSDVAWHENLGTPSPSFLSHLIHGAASGTRHATAADLDGDGDLDVVAAAGGSNAVLWYANDGGGSFGPPQVAGSVAGARSVAAADFDLDGDLDLVAAEAAAPGGFSWLRNDGVTPPTFTELPISNPGGAPFWVAAVDYDRDGLPDIVTTSLSGSSATWWKNTGPTFEPTQTYEGLPGATDLEIADLDADGDPDLLVAARNADRAVWLENRGPGLPAVRRPLAPVLDGALSLVALDADRNGTLDLAVACEAEGTVEVLLVERTVFWDDFEAGGVEAWSAALP